MVRIAQASLSENGTSGWDGKAKAGNQNGRELNIKNWYSKPWTVLLRPDPAIADKIAEYAEQIVKNLNVGYDQSQRNTLWQQYQLTNDFNKVGLCECDCSSFATVCAIAAGAKIVYGSNAPHTATMERRFTESGSFKAYADKKYLISSDYLKRGDILVRPNGHTVVVLDNGAAHDQASPEGSTSSFTAIAKEVIAGKWGNGSERRRRLTEAGYDYAEVQKEVNKLLKK